MLLDIISIDSLTAAQIGYFGPGPDPIHYSGVNCNGGEVTLNACSRDLTPSCTSHTQDVGVTCQDACTLGDIRLVDGSSPNEGRVEICALGGLWGTICDKGLDYPDVQVACYQLGYEYSRKPISYTIHTHTHSMLSLSVF